jgi:hypothetical protein
MREVLDRQLTLISETVEFDSKREFGPTDQALNAVQPNVAGDESKSRRALIDPGFHAPPRSQGQST